MAHRESFPIIGAHVSKAEGLIGALSHAECIGAEAIQFFGSSPRSWRTIFPTTEEIAAYHALFPKSGVRAVFLHASYLVNLASVSGDNYAYSTQSIIDHLTIAHMIGAQGLIFHLGSFKGGTKEEGMEKQVKAIQKALAAVPGDTQLIMENTAGGGDKIGASLEDIAYMLKAVHSPRLTVCYDTAHGFEAGLVSEYTTKSVKQLFDEWERVIGMEKLVAIHTNDSKTLSGSHHDQHENIGEGHIGLSGFKALAKEARIAKVPWILEVPGFEDKGPDKKNIDIFRSCFS